MKQLIKLAAAAAAGAAAAGSIVYAQTPPAAQPGPPPRAMVSIYQAAPGQQIGLLEFFAQQDRIAQAAGLAPAQLYVHTNGASWDYMIVSPVPTDEQEAAMGAAARRMGLPWGPRAGLEMRKHVATHTDTFTVGPVTAARAVTALTR